MEQADGDDSLRLTRSTGSESLWIINGSSGDQIEANKQVQRALHSRWDADPSGAPDERPGRAPRTSAPDERPDLNEVREEINRVNADLVYAIGTSTAFTRRY